MFRVLALSATPGNDLKVHVHVLFQILLSLSLSLSLSSLL